MTTQTVTLTLPDALYERVRETAAATARSIQEVLTQSIALALPPLEKDLSQTLRADLARLALLGDDELLRLADRPMDEHRQSRLAALAEAGKGRALRPDEAAELSELMEEAERVMLQRAEVYRILAQRGHRVFPRDEPADR